MSSMDKEIKNSDTNSGNVDQEEEQIKPNEVQLMDVSPNFKPVNNSDNRSDGQTSTGRHDSSSRDSSNESAPKRLRVSAVGELVEDAEKQLLNVTMEHLRYEVYKVDAEDGRDFTGPFQAKNGLRDTLAHFLYFAFGILSLPILISWLGPEICRSKSFLLPRIIPLRKPYYTYFIVSFTGPVAVLYCVYAYCFKYNLVNVLWCDFFLPCFICICMLGVVFIKHGMMDNRNYIKRNYKKKQLQKRKFSEIDLDRTFERNTQMSPLSIFTGLFGTTHMRQATMHREYRLYAKRILHFDKDEVTLPLGFKHIPQSKEANHTGDGTTNKQQPSKRRSIAQNPRHFNYCTSTCGDDVKLTTVKTIHIGDSITSTAVKKCNKTKPTISQYFFIADTIGVAYTIARFIALLSSSNYQLQTVHWLEWVVVVFSSLFFIRCTKPFIVQCALLHADFRRRLYVENRLATLIHQISITHYKHVDAWERLRIVLRGMGSPYYRLLQAYFIHLIAAIVLYFVTFTTCVLLDTKKTVPIYVSAILAVFGFFFEGMILLGIRTGSRTNRISVHHSEEWMEVKSQLLVSLADYKTKLRKMESSNSKLSPSTHTNNNNNNNNSENDSTLALRLKIEEINGAIQVIDNLLAKLKLELVFGGIRLMSSRLTKLLAKSLLLLFAYQIYYVYKLLIALHYYGGDDQDALYSRVINEI